MNNSGTKPSGKEYKTWGASRVNRLPGYDYAVGRPVHLTICAHDKKTVFGHGAEAEAVIAELSKAAQDLNLTIAIDTKPFAWCLFYTSIWLNGFGNSA